MTAEPQPLGRSSVSRTARRGRWWIAGAIVALAVMVIAYFQLSDSIEGNFRAPYTLFTLMGMLLLLTLWLLLLSPVRVRVRLVLLATEVLTIAAIVLFCRFELKMQGSWTGSGVPRLVWKSTPPLDAGLKPLAQGSDLVVEAADLATTTPADFPGFLGPDRSNSIHGVALSPQWDEAHAPRQLWRQTVGLGWGGISIVNGFAVTQEQRGDKELVICMEARTGRVRWQHANAARFSEDMGGDGPRATPTIAGGRVYVMGATGLLQCLDGATGKAIWSRNILSDHNAANITWGKSCSPLVTDNLVIVTGGEGPPALMAFDKATGSPRWSAGADKSGYSSGQLATLSGRKQVLIVNAHSATGHDPSDGKILWNFSWPGDWPKVSQAVPIDENRVFLSAGYGIGCVMLSVNPGAGETWTVSTAWKGQHMKTEFTNVVVREDFIYGLDDGVLACVDSKTGKRRWRDGRYGHGQILGVDELILVQSEDGGVALAKATPDGFHELGHVAALTGKTWNNPSLYGHTLLVRNDREAAAFELP